jgi:class 3 adenylate cyclase
MAQALRGWEGGREAHEWARFMRRAISQADFLASGEAAPDATPYLDRVQAPALILQPRTLPVEIAQKIASSIADARLVQVDQEPWMDLEGAARRIDEFLAEGDAATPATHAELPSGMTAILFLDIAGSTELTTRLGDAAYREKERQLDASLRAVIREARGTPVEGKVLGDGVMATFTSARDAIDAAIRCDELGRHAGLPLHIGIHAGDVLRERAPDGRDNVHGGAVQVAARIADASSPGEVLVSDIVRGLARTSAGVTFEDRGERELKGVSEPVRVFAVDTVQT